MKRLLMLHSLNRGATSVSLTVEGEGEAKV